MSVALAYLALTQPCSALGAGNPISDKNCAPISAVPEGDRLKRFVRKWILDITNVIHFEPDLVLCEIGDMNVFATVTNPPYKIGFGRPFFEPMMNSPRTNWEAISVLAHEIGHIALHAGRSEAATTVRQTELEADEFAGFILAALGVSEQTLEVFRKYGDSRTDHIFHHGTPDERAAAAYTGWKKQKLGLTYDTEYRPAVHGTMYALWNSREWVGIIGGVAGLIGSLAALVAWIRRRPKNQAS